MDASSLVALGRSFDISVISCCAASILAGAAVFSLPAISRSDAAIRPAFFASFSLPQIWARRISCPLEPAGSASNNSTRASSDFLSRSTVVSFGQPLLRPARIRLDMSGAARGSFLTNWLMAFPSAERATCSDVISVARIKASPNGCCCLHIKPRKSPPLVAAAEMPASVNHRSDELSFSELIACCAEAEWAGISAKANSADKRTCELDDTNDPEASNACWLVSSRGNASITVRTTPGDGCERAAWIAFLTSGCSSCWSPCRTRTAWMAATSRSMESRLCCSSNASSLGVMLRSPDSTSILWA